jgi:hypothetical protein
MPPKYEQIALRFFMARNLPLLTYNKMAPGLKYRPDFVFQRNEKLIILECDENQHATYCPKKERIREARIMAAYRRETGIKPKLIRYDPHPEGERACVRASMVADIVNRELHGVGHTPSTLKICQFVGEDKIVCY